MNPDSLVRAYKKIIRGTQKQAIVESRILLVAALTKSVVSTTNVSVEKVYVTTRALKHMYDKRPAIDFDTLLYHLPRVVRFPDWIYRNKDGKRGQWGFVKEINGRKFFCSVEEGIYQDIITLFVATFFATDDQYLQKFELIGNWKGGIPSS